MCALRLPPVTAIAQCRGRRSSAYHVARMHALVSGAAGFIGSTLVDALLAAGWRVRAVDAFTDSYDPAAKRANLVAASTHPACTVVEADLCTTPLAHLLDGVDVVFHLAARPGVRRSWAGDFGAYVEANITATQRLLDACADAPHLRRLVYASSSSVYGDAAPSPSTEAALPRPFSPYGVTKLAGEHLCAAYADNHGVPTVALRYFTVYGPRQRPDMAFARLIDAALSGRAFPRFGDGGQRRDVTFVDDVVAATMAAAVTPDVAPGTVCNISGGGAHRLDEAISIVGDLMGRPVAVEQLPAQPGDVRSTSGDATAARTLLGWAPAVGLRDGLARQIASHRSHRPAE